jgi:hypothetical protein
MSNVHSLRGTAATGEPVPGIIAELELRLEQARSGHLTAIAFVCVTTGHVVETGWEKGDGGGGVVSATSQALATGILSLSHSFAAAL